MNKDLEDLILIYSKAQMIETERLIANNDLSSNNWAHCEFCAGAIRSIMLAVMRYNLRVGNTSRKLWAAKNLLDYQRIELELIHNFN